MLAQMGMACAYYGSWVITHTVTNLIWSHLIIFSGTFQFQCVCKTDSLSCFLHSSYRAHRSRHLRS